MPVRVVSHIASATCGSALSSVPSTRVMTCLTSCSRGSRPKAEVLGQFPNDSQHQFGIEHLGCFAERSQAGAGQPSFCWTASSSLACWMSPSVATAGLNRCRRINAQYWS